MSQRALTSASNIHRRRDCPGSAFAEMGVIDEQSDYSDEGTMMHTLALSMVSDAAPKPEKAAPMLTLEQGETLEEWHRLFEQFQREVINQFGISDDETFVDEIEQELFVIGPDGSALYPGHADLIRTWPAKSVRMIVDAKFGRLDVDEAPDNTQLGSYAVAAYQRSQVDDTAVAIIQPRAFGQRVTRAIYGLFELGEAAFDLERIVTASRSPNAPRIASAHACQYCRAKLFCDAYKAKLWPMVNGVRDVELVTNDDLERLHDAVKAAASIAPRVKDELRRRIQAGAIEGWRLQGTGSTETITDTAEAYRRLLAEYPHADRLAERFMACLKPRWQALTELAVVLTGYPVKKARAWLNETFYGLIESEEKEATPKKL